MKNKSIQKVNKDKEVELQDPLKDIELSEKKQDELLLETFGESLIEKIPFLGSLIGYGQKYQNKVDSARLAILLNKFEEQLSSFDDFKNTLGKLLTSNAGIMLFHKTVRVVNAGNFEQEYIELLAKALKYIAKSDFEDLFNEHDYVLSQIEKLSPQALLVLNDYDSWRTLALQRGTTMSGQTIVGDWDTQATTHFAHSKGIGDDRTKKRIAHAFRELENNGMIFLTENKHIGLSPIGVEVRGYLI